MIVLDKAAIAARIDLTEAAKAVEAAYRAASAGDINLPPVGHITFDNNGDCHLKYGHRRGDDFFVVKVATGFPENDPVIAPVNNGVSLVLSAVTGELRAVLHDEMLLTDVRTGIGGAIASRALANPNLERMLVVGTGVQARHQIAAHRALLGPDFDIEVWGRSAAGADSIAAEHDRCSSTRDLAGACRAADIVVTVTATREPLISDDWIHPGIHITAVGADAPGKHELDPSILDRADVLVADSQAQCLDHGEFSALPRPRPIVELGEILNGTADGRRSSSQVTIADLTGIAAQDIAMAGVVLG